jgi:hypothetical protein
MNPAAVQQLYDFVSQYLTLLGGGRKQLWEIFSCRSQLYDFVSQYLTLLGGGK